MKTSWHALELGPLFQKLGSSEVGLSESEAQKRLQKYGPNKLPEEKPATLVQVFARQFLSPLIYILVAAAIVSLAIGDLKDALFIAAVLIINAVIGSYQEWKAEKSSHALKKLLQIQASVQRDQEVREINAEEAVPGDIVWLESGNRVPADIRLLSSHGLEVNESLLTGESLPILKDPACSLTGTVPMADRLNMTYAGSIVTRGRAKGIITTTGKNTVIGELALDVISGVGGKTPLLIRMERFTRIIALAVLLTAVGIGFLGVVFRDYAISEMLLFGIALAVSAIPEGLPVAMTVALAIASARMARRRVIVRRLNAVEGLGSCTYIGTDKTGTLTCNELMVKKIHLANGKTYDVTGEGFVPDGRILEGETPLEKNSNPDLDSFARASVLCNEADLHKKNDAWIWRGDTVDIALLSMSHKIGWQKETTLSRYPQIDEIPFEPEQRYAATFHKIDDKVHVFAKGAPERILAMCKDHLGAKRLGELEAISQEMAAEGFRVLAIAQGETNNEPRSSAAKQELSGLSFLGFAAMVDPLRGGVREAIRDCHEAGIKVAMITGDHSNTALAIARDLDLAHDKAHVVTGEQLETTSSDELPDLVESAKVFARVTPKQKLQIIQTAQKKGHFAAVTGDGANDAPALKRANIGIAMGKGGTDVARETAELVISDDNFSTIVGGVEEGRIAYDNIRKVIYLLISTGAAELILMGLAVFFGTPLPLLPAQLLWLNLVTNGIQDVALAFEPGEKDVLKRAPRKPKERIFNLLMIERTLVAAATMGIVAFLVFQWLLPDSATEAEIASTRNALLLLMVLFENIHLGNCRSETQSALTHSPLRSPFLIFGAAAAFSIHVLTMYSPWGQIILGAEPVSFQLWIQLLACAFIIFPVMEIHKRIWHFRRR